MHWLLTYRGSGFSCCLLFMGVLYGLYRSYDPAFPTFVSPQWESIFWSLEKVAVSLLISAMGHGVLLSLAACSVGTRQLLSRVVAILAEIPSLCLLGLVSALFSPFWSIVAVAAFSLLTRSVHATLDAGHEIPSGFLKTARALRLGRWQSFWRLHVPFAFPELVRSVLQDLPDFWLRVFGGEMIVSLFMPHKVSGLGEAFLSAVEAKEIDVAFGLFLLMILLVLLVQHGLITPLRGYGRRYAVCDLGHSEKNGNVSQFFTLWQRHCFWIGMGGSILTASLLTYKFWPWPEGSLAILGPFGYLGIALLVVGSFWTFMGGLSLGCSERVRYWIKEACLVGSLLPVPLLFVCLSPCLPWVILPSVAVLAACGWILFKNVDGVVARQFVTMGRHLRLPCLSLWKNVRIPLLCPALLQAGGMALPFFWDNVYMAAILGVDSNHMRTASLLLSLLQRQAYGMQGLFLCLMTLLAASVRWGVCMPLRERMAHRYRI